MFYSIREYWQRFLRAPLWERPLIAVGATMFFLLLVVLLPIGLFVYTLGAAFEFLLGPERVDTED